MDWITRNIVFHFLLMQHPHHDAFKMWFYKREIAAPTFPDISRTRCFDLCCGLRAIALREVKCDQRRQWGIGEHWSLHVVASSGGKCVLLLLCLTSGCRWTRWSCIACTACRWALSNHTCVPVTLCLLGNIRWGTIEKDLTVSPSHTGMHTRTHTGIHAKTHTSNCSRYIKVNTQHTQGTRIIFFFSLSPSSFTSQFLILPKCPHFCSHIFWRTEPCERQSPLL